MTFEIKIYQHPVGDRREMGPVLWQQTFATEAEFQEISRLCNTVSRVGMFTATVITVRTDTCENFCKDFFFPSVVNHALKTHDLATKIFIGIVWVFWDLATLPIRLITLIPRHFYNQGHSRQLHPLQEYLASLRASEDLLRADTVYLKKKWVEQNLQCTSEGTFDFVEVPQFATSVVHTSGSHSLP